MAIKGEWGIGKTYFWDNYFNNNKSNLGLVAYSYVSLFGIGSIDELKTKLFHNGKPLMTTEEIREEFKRNLENSNELSQLFKKSSLFKNILDAINSKIYSLNKFTWFTKYIPQFSSLSKLQSIYEYNLVNKYLICFDDLERCGESLNIKDVMGLIDELSVKKNCKILLILNENTFDDEQKLGFDKYREKIIDFELEYKPSIESNLEIIFPEKNRVFKTLLNSFSILKVRNIRIFKKVKFLLDTLSEHTNDLEDILIDEITTHICVFSWGYYCQDRS